MWAFFQPISARIYFGKTASHRKRARFVQSRGASPQAYWMSVKAAQQRGCAKRAFCGVCFLMPGGLSARLLFVGRGAVRGRGKSPSPHGKKRIPAPVCTPRALASRRALARNDSAPRWEQRDTWVPPYGVRRSSRVDRGVRPYKAKQEPRKTGRRGRRPLRNHKGCVQWAGGGVRPYNGTAGTACPTNRRGAAGTAKFRNFFFPLSASAGLRRLYSDDTGRPSVL